MNLVLALISPFAALLLSPLLPGIINRIKAIIAGRRGQPLLQPYLDLIRLFRKGSVFSQTTTWIFRLAPMVVFCSTLAASAFVPLIQASSLLSFRGDVIFLLYFLALSRFFLILSALDTGSAFEGMGASREAFFSALAEPALLLCLAAIMRANHTASVAAALCGPAAASSVTVVLAAVPLFIIMLAENARIPFDDPTTHLELTMIHEVMILDNSGPGLALLEWAAAIKLWVFSLVIAKMLLPLASLSGVAHLLALAAAMALMAIAVGLVESFMARLRLIKIPQLLFGAAVIALLGFFINAAGVVTL
jgi:formate hydrogenlyase subunit 4